MKSWMSFLNRPRRIVAAVTAVHIVVLLLFVISKTATPTKKEPTPLVVQTVKLKPPPKPQPVIVAAPKPKAKPKPKPQPKAKPKSSNNRLANLVQEAQNRLAKVDEKVKVKATPKRTALAIDQSSYEEELTERLRLLLKLPEWGSVRLALTLDRQGAVQGVKILSAQSETNRDYVVEQLERTSLAPFGKHFEGEQEHTFTLTLNNEM